MEIGAEIKTIGARVKPFESLKFLVGSGNYVDDIHLPRMVHAAFLRSPYPHAYIQELDTSKAKKLTDVLSIRAGQELNTRIDRIMVGEGVAGVSPLEVTPLAAGKVRMVGDAVAVAVATDRYIAEDALDLIQVKYEPLPVELDSEKAAQAWRIFSTEWKKHIALMPRSPANLWEAVESAICQMGGWGFW